MIREECFDVENVKLQRSFRNAKCLNVNKVFYNQKKYAIMYVVNLNARAMLKYIVVVLGFFYQFLHIG